MPIVIKCPGCSKRYKLRDELAGKRVKCQCGHGMIVPSPARAGESDEGTYGVAPTADVDRISSLLDEDWSPGAEGPPLGGRVLASPSGGSLQTAGSSLTADELAAEELAKEEGATRRAAGLLALVVLAGLLAVGGAIFLVVKLAFRPGFASPEEAFAAHQEAFGNMEWKAQLRTYTAEAQTKIVGATMLIALGMAKSSPEIRGVLESYGLEELIEADSAASPFAEIAAGTAAETPTDASADAKAEPVDWEQRMAEWEKQMKERQQRVASAVKEIRNKPAFYADLMRAIQLEQRKHLPDNPVMRLMVGKAKGDMRRARAKAKLNDLEIEGDTAQATMSFTLEGQKFDSPVAFKKVGGRWFMDFAEPEELAGGPFGSPFVPSGFLP